MLKLILNTTGNTWEELEIIDTEIILHKAFSDMEAPDSIQAAYTLQCRLPYTEKNVNVLGALYNLDYVIGTHVFDQRKKFPFKLLYNESSLYQGSFVLEKSTICKDSSQNLFDVTLYDETYDVFTKLDYTLADPAESLDSTVDRFKNINALNGYLTAETVAASINGQPTFNTIMKVDSTTGERLYEVEPLNDVVGITRAIGFIPTYKIFDGFDYGKMIQTTQDGSALYPGSDILNLEDFGNLPAKEYPEACQQIWKTYHMKPYIWYSSYIDFLASEIFRTTGYRLDYTTDWFKLSNPYYTNLIRTLKYPESLGSSSNGLDWATITDDTNLPTHISTNMITSRSGSSITFNLPCTVQIDTTKLEANATYRVHFKANMSIMNAIHSLNVVKKSWRINRRNELLHRLSFSCRDASNNVIFTKTKNDSYISEKSYRKGKTVYTENQVSEFDFSGSGYTYTQGDYIVLPSSYFAMYKYDSSNYLYPDRTSDGTRITPSTPNKPSPDSYLIEYDVKLTGQEVAQLMNCTNLTVNLFANYQNDTYDYYEPEMNIDSVGLYYNNIELSIDKLEQKKLDFPSLLGNNEFNILKEVTTFIKTFNLVTDLDYSTKTMRLFNRGEYFNKYHDGRTGWMDKIEDWSSKVNLNEVLEHTAIISDYRNLEYNYEDRDTPNNIESKKTSTFNAGYENIDLGYEVKDESYPYREGLYNSMIGKVNGYWLYDYILNRSKNPHPSSMLPPLYIDNDADGKPLEDVGGQLLFRNRVNIDYRWCMDGNNNYMFAVAQDSDWEIAQGEFYMPVCVNHPTFYKYMAVLPSLPNVSTLYDSITSDTSISTMEDYERLSASGTRLCSEWSTHIGDKYSPEGVDGIYNIFHEKWNNLIYNINSTLAPNIKVQCYLHYPLEDYLKFNFSHLIRIENNIYLVLSIDEYSFNNQIMKVTLVQLRRLSSIDNMDRNFGDEWLLVSPRYNYIAKTGLGFTGTFAYDVYHTAPTVTETAPASLPSWFFIDSSTSNVINGGERHVITYHTDPSTYPVQQQAWSLFRTYADSSTSDVCMITNIPSSSVTTRGIWVQPAVTIITNVDSSNYECHHFTVNTNWKYSHYTLDTTGNIVAADSVLLAAINNGNGTYTVSIFFKPTSGVAGQQQNITFYNTLGDSYTVKLQRGDVEFNHEVAVSNITSSQSLGINYMLLDYKTLSDPLTSVTPFTVLANFDFRIYHWDGTMHDSAIDETCYDKNYEMELWDVTDPQNPVKYLPQQGFTGSIGKYYQLEWRYHRRRYRNSQTYRGYFNIQCIDGHTATPYVYKINTVAWNLNNNL